jgi:capsular polysaccharide biosynthesis protein
MELKAYIKLFRKNFLFIVICVAVATAIAYYAAHKAQTGYKLEQTYFLSQAPVQTFVSDQQPTQPSGFGNYYQQETSRNFTDTVVSILESPDFYSQFSLSYNDISTQKVAPQLIKIIITSPTSSEAKFLLERLVIGFNQNLKIWDPSGNLELKAIGQSREPVINSLDIKVVVAAGAILGFALAICVVALKTYFKL